MSNLTPPLKWHGGKHYLADWIISHMPRHVHYVEPYFGGGAVLLAKDPEGVSEVVNDINQSLIRFWRVFQSRILFQSFQRLVEAIPFAEQEFGRAANLDGCRLAGTSNMRELEKEYGWSMIQAAMFFVHCRQSRQGLQKDFATLSRNRTRRGMNEQASAWLTAIAGLPEVHARLKRVVVLNRPALDVIRTQDGPKTLFYFDPPYLGKTRESGGEYGEHEMSDEDHEDLLESLCNIKGKFLLSGYPSNLYNEYEAGQGWHRVDKLIDCKASSAKSKPKKTECLWMNFEPKPEEK